MHRTLRPAILCLRLAMAIALAGLAGCPKPLADPDGPEINSANFEPKTAIAKGDPLSKASGLWLGMSNVELSQVYNAPEGKGDGFTRTLEQHGDVTTQTITFEQLTGQPQRMIVAMLYRDQLYWVAERRDALTAEQADAWFADCQQAYGAEPMAVLPTSQWIWGDAQAIEVTFTRDNASPLSMAANLVLLHRPTYQAAHAYLRALEEREQSQATPEPGQS